MTEPPSVNSNNGSGAETLRSGRRFWGCFLAVVAIVSMLVLAIGLPIYRKHLFVQDVRQRGGWVNTDDSAPAWLKRMLGEKRIYLAERPFFVSLHQAEMGATDADLDQIVRFGTIERLDLSEQSGISDAGLAKISGLSRMQYLHLNGTTLTDDSAASLSRLAELRQLSLWRTRITDAGVANIRGLSKLEYLHLGGPGITDEGMRIVGSFPSLTRLLIYDSPVSDAGIRHLRNLTALRELRLVGTQITDRALAELDAFPELTYLQLRDTRATDAGIPNFTDIAKSDALDVTGPGISDAGLKFLHGKSSLRTLDLVNTRVTEDGVRDLKESLPHLDVSGWSRTR
jgi:hypothetical protein